MAYENANPEITMDTETAVNALKAYIAQSEKNQAIAAKELGVSGSQISAFLKGKYPAPHTLIPKIENLIKMSEKKEVSPKEPGFKMTSISQKVIDLITYCHVQGKIGVAYGDAGVGKTMSVKEYVRRNPEAIMITTYPCFASIAGVNELLADALRIKDRSPRRIFTETVRKLTDSNRVIIIDEAQHLTAKVINHLRSIWDVSGVGMAFIGNEEIYLEMTGGSGQKSYAQLYNRIAPPPKDLVTSKILLEDIRLVFEDMGLDGEALDILHKISKTNYGLRGAVYTVTNTIIGYKIKDCKELSAARIARTAKEMRIG